MAKGRRSLPMDELHNALNEAIRDQWVPARIAAAIVRRKLKAQGIRCSSARSLAIGERIAEQLRSGTEEGLSIVSFPWGRTPHRNVHLELTAEDINGFAEKTGEELGQALLPMAKELAGRYLSSVRHKDYEGMRTRRADLRRFRSHLRARWGMALDSFERLLAVAQDSGDAANAYLRSGKAGKPGALVEAISRIHARACHVGGEILALLESGHADGAHARWRTLHELTVVGALLSDNDNDLAERYLLHEVIESVRAARQLEDYAAEIGEKPLSKRELDKLVAAQKELCERFGPEFGKPYGWAAKLLNNPNPNFDHIEKSATLNHLRPYYKLASYNVHATAKGAAYRLGLLGSRHNVLLAGPSNAGLEEAGTFAAHSLLTITLFLLTIQTTLDGLVYGQLLIRLREDVDKQFSRAAAKLRADDRRLSRRSRASATNRTTRGGTR